MTSRITGSRAFPIAVAIFVLTVGQLAVATFVPGLSQFEGKGFGVRLALYPAMMLLVPAIWLIRHRRSARTDQVAAPDRTGTATPWTAFAWIMLPFLIDVTGNTLDLYDAISWWDDLNHLLNWLFLSLGVGLLVRRAELGPRWALGLLIAGIGAMMAIGWEVGEYYAFIRHSSELQTAYTDTLGDEVLGTLGATVAALILTLTRF